ncbi:MAG: ParB/RepB/Spo0J family partition protein [Opitutales bacterium]
MAKKAMGLGRGLGGLISSGVATKTEAPTKPKQKKAKTQSKAGSARSSQKAKGLPLTEGETLIEVPIGKVRPNRYQPRKRINAEQVNELAASIKAAGLIQPIAARSSEDGYEIIAGERRWRAYRQLGRKTIPVRVMEVEDASSAVLSLIENLQREGLDPVEEALGCSVLIQDFELTQAQVAERLGKSRVYVTNALRLLQLDEQLQQYLADERLSVGHAKVLLGLEDEAARLRLAKKIVGNGLSVRQAEDEVDVAKAKAKGRSANPAARENAKAAKEMAVQLSNLLKTKVRVSSNGEGKGRIMIDYGSSDELVTLGSRIGL